MLNINDLTLGQIKELQAIFSSREMPPTPVEGVPTPDPFVGKYVIIRTYAFGVHAGYLVSQEKDIVLLRDSRRLWNWNAVAGVALNGVAKHGLKSGCKVDKTVELTRITGVGETILCSESARDNIEKY